MKFSIMTNRYRVIDTGVFITYDCTSDAIIDVDTENGFKFKLTLKFNEDDEKQHKLIKEVTDDIIILSCVNFNSSLGIGTKKPLHIATVDDKALLFHFWVSTVENDMRRIEYTFLQEV